jgi:hypothetical protein
MEFANLMSGLTGFTGSAFSDGEQKSS